MPATPSVSAGEFKMLVDVVKGRISSSFPPMSNVCEQHMWIRLEQDVTDRASSICRGMVEVAQSAGATLDAAWFCDRRKELSTETIPTTARAHLNVDFTTAEDGEVWNRLAQEMLATATVKPDVVDATPAHAKAEVPSQQNDAQSSSVAENGMEAEEKVEQSSHKRTREEFEVESSNPSDQVAKAQAITPVKDEDDASQSAGGRMRAEEHRRRQINSEMLNALRSELPERDRAAYTGGNNSTVNTLSHAIDFIQKLKEKKARCLQELALLDGASDAAVFGDAPGIVHPLQQVPPSQQSSQMNLARMMPPPMGAPSQMGLDAFMGLGMMQQQPQPATSNHRVGQYLKIAQVSALTLECLAFSNPSAWLPIGNVSVGSGVLAVHESNGLCGRIVGEIKVPFATVLKRLQEREWHQHVPDWSPCTVHASSTVEVVGPGTGVFKTTLSSPSAPSSLLELCQIRHVMASTTVQGRLILSFTSTSHDSPALTPGAETAQMNPSGCILEANADGSGCKIVVVMDLGPGWGAAEGIVQQLLRANFQATAQMALQAPPVPAPARSPSGLSVQAQHAQLLGMLGGSHAPYQQQQQQQGPPLPPREKIVRADSFPSLCLGGPSTSLGLSGRAPSAQDDLSWMPPTGIEVRQGDIMDILKRAGKHASDMGQMPPGSDSMKRPNPGLAGLLQQQHQQ